MNTNLRLIGAGEFRSFQEGIPGSYFIRFLRGDGALFDLPASEEQLAMLIEFDATAEQSPAEERTPAHTAAPEPDDPPPLVLRRAAAPPPHLFVTPDDEREL
jgi:hypothetical protein